MPKELALREREEVVGAFKGISSSRLFTEVTIADHVLPLENGRGTDEIVSQLKGIKRGTKIGILRFNGGFRVRRVER